MTPYGVGIVMGSYVIGSVPTGYWLGKAWRGIDIRQQGSGNLGATNVFRVLGPLAGTFTLLVDIAKGVGPVKWAQHSHPASLELAVTAGLAAIAGHTTSLFVGGRGGKGVATSAGVFGALLPIPALIAIAVFLVCLAITRMVSASSICAAIALAAAAFRFSPAPLLNYTAVAVACLVIWTHRSNIKRILAGTESRIGAQGKAS